MFQKMSTLNGETSTPIEVFALTTQTKTFEKDYREVYVDMVRYEKLPVLSLNGVSQTAKYTKTKDNTIKEAIFYFENVKSGDKITDSAGYMNIYAKL